MKLCRSTDLAGMSPVSTAVTFDSRDAGEEPTGMYSRRVTAVDTGLMPASSFAILYWLTTTIILSLLAPILHAEEGVTVTITAPYIDIHTGPGRGYPIFHVAEKHETLRLLKRRTDWYKVITADGKTGWVAREDLHNTLSADGVLLDFSTPGWQGYKDKRWELGLYGGDFSGARALTINLGLRMTPHLSTELKYTQAFGNFSDSKLVSLNIVHRPFPEWRLTPFFILGAGTVTTSPNATLVETEDRQNNVLSVGGGVVFYISQRFSLRAEYNHHTLLTTRENNQEVNEWKAGFSVSF